MNINLIEQTVVVVAEFFNPSTFNQYWFIKEELLKEEDMQKESLFVPGITQVQSAKFNMLVVPDKIQITLKCSGDEAYNIISKILTKVLQYNRNIPYKALGINFCWELVPKESISKYGKKLFYKEGVKLYEVFNEDNARFGAYMSQNFKNARLKLDIKPVLFAEKECMIYNFNFHHDISDADDILSNKDLWKDYLDKSKEIIDNICVPSL